MKTLAAPTKPIACTLIMEVLRAARRPMTRKELQAVLKNKVHAGTVSGVLYYNQHGPVGEFAVFKRFKVREKGKTVVLWDLLSRPEIDG